MVNAGWKGPDQNPLRRYIVKRGWTETNTMNLLQEYGIISDNAITLDDVGNYAKAMMWLHERKEDQQS